MRGEHGQDTGVGKVIDLPTVRVSGVRELARARVLWRNGELRVFNKDGRVAHMIKATEPVQEQKGWLTKRWRSSTPLGDLVFISVCRCGFRKIANIPAEELWVQ